jgi:predicted MFS family arabinose efflux permease
MPMTLLLRRRSFGLLWLGGLLAGLCAQASRIMLIVHVFRTSNSVLALSLLVTVEALLATCAAPFAGTVIDRRDKRAVLIGSMLAQAGALLAIAARPTLELVWAMAGLHAVAVAFFQPAKIVAIPMVVDGDDLTLGNGLDQSATNLALIAGPFLGTWLLGHAGLATALLAIAAASLAAAAMFAGMALREAHPSGRTPATSTFADIKDVVSYLAGHRLVLQLTLVLFTALLCTGLWTPLAPFFIRDRLGGGDYVLGWQLSAFGLGATIGGLCAPGLIDRLGKGVTLRLGFLGEGSCLTAYALTSHVGVSLMVTFAWGFLVSVIVVPFHTILQLLVADRFLGRVFAVVRLCESSATVVTILLAAPLAVPFGSQWILLSAGLVYSGTVAVWSWSPTGRTLAATR